MVATISGAVVVRCRFGGKLSRPLSASPHPANGDSRAANDATHGGRVLVAVAIAMTPATACLLIDLHMVPAAVFAIACVRNGLGH